MTFYVIEIKDRTVKVLNHFENRGDGQIYVAKLDPSARRLLFVLAEGEEAVF